MASDDSKSGETDDRPCFIRYITAVARTWGILTTIALWFCTVKMLMELTDYIILQWYTLAVTILVTFLEFAWILTKCACCADDGGCCCTCWRVILWLDNWKKSILYILLAIPEFLFGLFSLYTLLSGCLLAAMGVFYFMKAFKYFKCVGDGKKSEEHNMTSNLVENEAGTSGYDAVNTDK